jgi:hypothetical protein
MRARITLLFSLLGLLLSFGTQAAQAQEQAMDTWVDYAFGQQITFHARLKTDEPVSSAVVFFQAAGDNHTPIGQAEVTPGKDGSYELQYTHKLSEYTLRSFAEVTYRWEATLQDGSKIQSIPARFYYDDNRYNWRSLEEKPFRLHWHEGDLTFAQSALDAAQAGLQRIQELLPLPAPPIMDIYIYPDSRSMQATLHPSSAQWIAGHADPDLGVIVAALPPTPDQRPLIEQRIPHELMHVLLYRSTNLGYKNLPTWLNEGLASLAELYPNSDYQILLTDAVQRGSLLPMSSLCQGFPREASSALLSYAQSASFVKYLYSNYGSSGLQQLVTAYANGLDCNRGAEYSLGKGLAELERGWRQQNFSENNTPAAFMNLLPWLVLMAAILITPLILLARRLRSGTTARAANQGAR